MVAINTVVDLTLDGDLAVVTLDSPPVNALSPRLMEGIYHAFVQAIEDPSAKAILLICAGRTFIAGADLKSLGSEKPEVDFFDLQARVENAGKPVVAAIHGTCLGGGMEVALTCNYRVAVPSARLGLPEVNLGLLPGGGGTQRLPRIVGVGPALDILVSGRQIGAAEALKVGLIDAIVAEEDLRGEAIAYANQLAAEAGPAKRVRDLEDQIGSATPAIFAEARERAARERPGEVAPLAIIRCVEAAAKGDFDAGIAVEREEFATLLDGAQSAALRHVFFAERQTAKVPGLPKDAAPVALDSIAVVGDGADDWIRSAQARGLTAEAAIAGHSLVIQTTGRDLAALQASLKDARAAAPDAVILVDAPEFALDRLVEGLADSSGIAALQSGAGSRLADIVRSEKSAPEAVLAALALAKKLGKVGVVTSGGGISIGARLLGAARAAVAADLGAGVNGADIAAAAAAFGFRADRLAAIGLPSDVGVGGQSDRADRLIFAVIGEAVTLLDEGAAARSSDLDVAAILGLGWPSYTGGPLFYAQALGIEAVAARLEAFGILAAAILRKKIAAGESIA